MNRVCIRSRRAPLLATLLCALSSALPAACSSPSAPALIKEEIVCSGFEQGGQKMRGGLKQPVRLRVMEDDEAVATVMLFGVPDDKHPTRFLLPDKEEEYTLEFAQCQNVRAPQPDDGNKGASKGGVQFVCNEPAVYTTVKHTTKKGDAASMEIAFPAPPIADCWQGQAPATK
jgi:hypothetical protein